MTSKAFCFILKTRIILTDMGHEVVYGYGKRNSISALNTTSAVRSMPKSRENSNPEDVQNLDLDQSKRLYSVIRRCWLYRWPLDHLREGI